MLWQPAFLVLVSNGRKMVFIDIIVLLEFQLCSWIRQCWCLCWVLFTFLSGLMWWETYVVVIATEYCEGLCSTQHWYPTRSNAMGSQCHTLTSGGVSADTRQHVTWPVSTQWAVTGHRECAELCRLQQEFCLPWGQYACHRCCYETDGQLSSSNFQLVRLNAVWCRVSAQYVSSNISVKKQANVFIWKWMMTKVPVW